MFIIRTFLDSDIEEIISLWELSGLTHPFNNPEIDIFRKQHRRMISFWSL